MKKVEAKSWKWTQVGEFRVRQENMFQLINAVVSAFILIADPTISIPITGFPDEIKLSRTNFVIDGDAKTLKLRTDVSFKANKADAQVAALLSL